MLTPLRPSAAEDPAKEPAVAASQVGIVDASVGAAFVSAYYNTTEDSLSAHCQNLAWGSASLATVVVAAAGVV